MSGPAAIPVSEIQSYIELMCLPDPGEALYLIQQLDHTFLDYAQRQQKSKESGNGRTRSRNQGRRRSPRR